VVGILLAGLDINSFTIRRNDSQMAPAGMQTNIEQIVSPAAVSESGPGADLYTYVERREPRIISQQPSPANTTQNAIGQAVPSPRDGNNNNLGPQISQGRRATVGQANSRLGALREAAAIAGSSSFPPTYPHASDNLTP